MNNFLEFPGRGQIAAFSKKKRMYLIISRLKSFVLKTVELLDMNTGTCYFSTTKN